MAELVRFPDFDKRVRARRTLALAPQKTPRADKVLAALRDRYQRQRDGWRRGIEFGEKEFPPDMIALAREGDAILTSAAIPADATLEACAAVEAMLGHRYNGEFSILRIVAAERGVAFAVTMKARSLRVGAVTARDSGTWKMGLGVHPDDHDAGWDDSWDALRDVVARADDAAYRGAVAAATVAREGAPLRVRALVDFAFPDEPAWANADLAAALAQVGIAERLYYVAPLLASIDDPALAAKFVALAEDYQTARGAAYAVDLAAGLPPPGAIGVLCTYLDKCVKTKTAGKTALVDLAVALAALHDEESARHLATLLVHPQVGPVAVAYMARFPELAARVLPDVAKGTSKNADAARAILATSAAKSAPAAPAAPREALPPLLRDPPWTKKATPPLAPLVLEPLPFEEHAAWDAGEREAMLALAAKWWDAAAPPLGDEDLAALNALPPHQRYVDQWTRWTNGAWLSRRVPPEVGLALWNASPLPHTRAPVETVLAFFGDAAIPGLLARDAFANNTDALFRAQLRVVSPRTAKIAAKAIARRKAWRKDAYAWLRANAEVAALGLLPAALGARDKEQAEAEVALLWLARQAPEVVVAVAARYGTDAAAVLARLTARDPLADLTVRGKLPAYLDPAALPPLSLRGGGALDATTRSHVLDILRSTEVEPPYAGIEILRESIDPASLATFAWALTETWALAGAKSIHAWMALSLAHFGDDASARKLAPLVREWGRKDAKKCDTAIAILVATGTDTALLHLGTLAESSRFEVVRNAAEAALSDVARDRGLTIDELRDRTVPDLDLDASGTATLDFGPRTFTVSFDEALRPILTDASGAKLGTLPRGSKTDDAAKVKEVGARWKSLKTEAEAVRGALVARFEAAMCRARPFAASSFWTHVAGHPLVRHIARRLVWATREGATFRLTEDGTLADEKDVKYTLLDATTVTPAHVLALSAETRAAWAEVFSDYEIIQPFEQLGRATFTLTAEEAAQRVLRRHEGRKSKAGPLLGALDARGWDRTIDLSVDGFSKSLVTRDGKEVRASFSVTPGIPLDDIANAPEQVFGELGLEGTIAFSAIAPIDISELLRDLESVAR